LDPSPGRSQPALVGEELKLVAQLFGTPGSAQPGSLSDFQDLPARAARQRRDRRDRPAREVAETVLRPPVTLALRPALEALGLLTAGLLPESLREQYNLPCDRARAALLAGSAQTLRRALLPLLPDIVRAVGPERRARERRTLPFDPLTALAR
jgi:uncharacterized protein (DUF2236 family)